MKGSNLYTFNIDEEDNHVTVTSPSGQTRSLYGEDKEYFFQDLNYLDEKYGEGEEFLEKASNLIRDYYWEK